MEYSIIRKLNIFSVAVTILLVPFMGMVSLTSPPRNLYYIETIILAAIAAIIVLICYLINVILGLIGIGTGKRWIIKTVANAQIVMYSLWAIWEGLTYLGIKKNVYREISRLILGLMIAAVVLLVLAIIRNKILKNINEDYVCDGKPGLAMTLFGVELGCPAASVLLIIFTGKLFDKYPGLKVGLGIAVIVLFIIVGLTGLYFILSLFDKIFNGNFDFAVTRISLPAGASSKSNKSAAKDKAVREFDARYDRGFRNVTGGVSPWAYSSMKEGPKREAAKKFRANMEAEARSNGYIGKSKFFPR